MSFVLTGFLKEAAACASADIVIQLFFQLNPQLFPWHREKVIQLVGKLLDLHRQNKLKTPLALSVCASLVELCMYGRDLSPTYKVMVSRFKHAFLSCMGCDPGDVEVPGNESAAPTSNDHWKLMNKFGIQRHVVDALDTRCSSSLLRILESGASEDTGCVCSITLEELLDPSGHLVSDVVMIWNKQSGHVFLFKGEALACWFARDPSGKKNPSTREPVDVTRDVIRLS